MREGVEQLSLPGSQMHMESRLSFSPLEIKSQLDKVVYTSNPSTLGLRQEDHELGHKARPFMNKETILSQRQPGKSKHT